MSKKEQEIEVPGKLGPLGADYYRRVLEDFELYHSELLALEHQSSCLDEIERLEAEYERSGVLIEGQRGPRANPLLREIERQKKLFLEIGKKLGIIAVKEK